MRCPGRVTRCSRLLGREVNCHGTAKDGGSITGPSPLASHRPCSRSRRVAATRIELVNATSLSHLFQGQALLGKSNIHPRAVEMPRCWEAGEQVNAGTETPAAHTIGSERCQLWRLEARGHVVLEKLELRPAAPALPRPWDGEFLPGKAATPS